MDATPSRSPRSRRLPLTSATNASTSGPSNRIKKPPPITPRRFTRFFTPRPQNASHVVRTSRAALRAISGAALNTRQSRGLKPATKQTAQEHVTPRGRKRKLSFVLADPSTLSTPPKAIELNHGQDLIRSSPTIPERCTPTQRSYGCSATYDTEDETEVDEDLDEEERKDYEPIPRIVTYRSKSVNGSLLSSRITGRKKIKEAASSRLWQEETAHFSTSVEDINAEFSGPTPALPFSTASCHTNSLVAVGDEEGRIRLLDTASHAENGMTRAWLSLEPHDNALMDLEFSPDDQYLATASGDQTCQIIDVQSQTSVYLLTDHRSSVKKVAFQPGSGNQVLASCGRDGQVTFWDLRCNNTPCHKMQRRLPPPTLMMRDARSIAPTHRIRDAHTGTKVKLNHLPKANTTFGRSDFSVTSLSFLGDTRPNLLVTTSELDSMIKLWDMRTSYGSHRRAPNPLSMAEAPQNHAYHRSFGITSIALCTDASKLYSLSRDHTVYAYSTSHLILGSSGQLSQSSKASKASESYTGLGPLYGFRHPNLRIQTFWNRLAIRKATDRQTELLAVGSSNDCAVLFPTNERYLTAATKEVPAIHNTVASTERTMSTTNEAPSRPALIRASSSQSLSHRLMAALADDNPLPIYQHGTPLVRGHDKEVTSLTWSSEGHLVTASDDYTVRCWRETPDEARRLRLVGEKSGARWRKGWSHVGISGFDDDC